MSHVECHMYLSNDPLTKSVLHARQRHQRRHHRLNSLHAGCFLHINPLVEGVRSASESSGVDRDGGDSKAHRNIGIGAAGAEPWLHSEFLDDRARDLYDRGVDSGLTEWTLADRLHFELNPALSGRASAVFFIDRG